MTKPEILFLSHRIPYPPDKGDKIRSWRLFDHLSKRFHVHLACFIDDPKDHAYTAFLRERSASAVFVDLNPKLAKLFALRGLLSGAPLSFDYFHSRRMEDAVKSLREKPLAAEFAFSSTMAPYLDLAITSRPRIIDFCDADSEKWRQYAQSSQWPFSRVYKREAGRLLAAETNIANSVDLSFAASPQEAAIFNARPDVIRKVGWVRNGVDTDHFHPGLSYAPVAVRPDVVFVGAMDYRANLEAVMNFIAETWPSVRAVKKDAVFAVVGRNPSPSVQGLHGQNGIIVTGAVDDVRPWLAAARIVAAPMRVAQGVQNKVLEAMAMGKAMVATSQAMTGVEGGRGAVCVADDPVSLSAAILGLLDDPDGCKKLGAKARHTVLQHHNWSACLTRLDEALGGLGLYGASSNASFMSSSAASIVA